MFSRVGDGWWQRGDSLNNGVGPRRSRTATGFTRRQVLLAPPVISLAGFAAPAAAGARKGSELVWRDVYWPIAPEAFGLTSLPPVVKVARGGVLLDIPNARWPGTGLRYDLTIELNGLEKDVTVRLSSRTLGFSNPPLSFAEFVASGAKLAYWSASSVAAVARALGWGMARTGSGTLSFFHDLSWQGAVSLMRTRLHTMEFSL